jgi:hypothetical protein
MLKRYNITLLNLSEIINRREMSALNIFLDSRVTAIYFEHTLKENAGFLPLTGLCRHGNINIGRN